MEVLRGRTRRRRVEELRDLLAQATPGGRELVLKTARSIGGERLSEIEEAIGKIDPNERARVRAERSESEAGVSAKVSRRVAERR